MSDKALVIALEYYEMPQSVSRVYDVGWASGVALAAAYRSLLAERDALNALCDEQRDANVRVTAERDALAAEVVFLKTFADPPDMATGKTTRDTLRQRLDALTAPNPCGHPARFGPDGDPATCWRCQAEGYANLLAERDALRQRLDDVNTKDAIKTREINILTAENRKLHAENETMLSARVGRHCELMKALGLDPNKRQVDEAQQAAIDRIAALRQRVTELEEWKREAWEVMDPVIAAGHKLSGLGLGESVTEALIARAQRCEQAEAALKGVPREYGPPCFHLLADGQYCLRPQRWSGHQGQHPFVGIEDLPDTAFEETP